MRNPVDATIVRRLGLQQHEAAVLLAAMGARLGRRSRALRVAAFLAASSRPAERLLPRAVRRRALAGLVGPLLESPAALNLYAAGRPWAAGEPCSGLVESG